MTQVALDNSLLARLNNIAVSRAMSSEDILREAVTNYLELAELQADVEKGRNDIANGNIYSSEDVEAYFSHKRNMLRTSL